MEDNQNSPDPAAIPLFLPQIFSKIGNNPVFFWPVPHTTLAVLLPHFPAFRNHPVPVTGCPFQGSVQPVGFL